MFQRSALVFLTLVLLLPATLFAKPKTKVFNNTPDEVFRAALKTARERHVITFTDEKNRMLTFQTGRSALSNGFVANASIDAEDGDKAKLTINVQHKSDGSSGFSFNAGDRMADKFFEQVQEELAHASSQPVTEKPETKHVEVPAGPADAKADAGDKGSISVASNPDGGDISVDGSFVGNAPAVLKLTPGKHTVSVTLNGYQAWTKELSVMAGSEVKLNGTLTK